MKKFILTLFVGLFGIVAFGQGKWQEKQNNYFADAAAKEYNLSLSQKEELKKVRMKMVRAFMDSSYEFKEGFITETEMKELNKKASREFNSAFSTLVGKPYKEVEPFLARMRKELKNLK